MFKCRTAEKNDLESSYKKSSTFVANSLTHYKNPMVNSYFFFIFCSPDFAESKSAIKNHLSIKETEIFKF
jgi:hypothetical protein